MSSSIQHKTQRYSFPKPYADFVARIRVPIGFVLLIAFAWLSKPSRSSILLSLPVSLAGLGVRAWAAGHLAKDRQLATTGPYAYVRNPLYMGTLMVAAGIVITARDFVLGIIFAVTFVLVYLPAIGLEEQHLRDIFPEYKAYANRINRFFSISKWHGAPAQFSWHLYRKNEEYNALLGFLLAMLWLLWKSGAL